MGEESETLHVVLWLCAQGKANFFERRVGEYQKAGVMSNRNGERMTFEQFVFTTDEDF